MIKTRSDSTVELIEWNATDVSVARSAKVSYGKDMDPRLEDEAHVSGLIGFLVREKHLSPFDHGSATFLVETPIFVAREIFRHRSSQFSEISGRYTKWDFEFYVPSTERPIVQAGKAGNYSFESGTNTQHALIIKGFEKAYGEALNTYEQLLDAGVAKEVARDCLPLGMYTRFYFTLNIRNLMHFLNLRGSGNPQALYEIREVADKMEEFFKEQMPLTHKAWKENQ